MANRARIKRTKPEAMGSERKQKEREKEKKEQNREKGGLTVTLEEDRYVEAS